MLDFGAEHCRAVAAVLRGNTGEIYNIAPQTELENLTLIHRILDQLGCGHHLIRFVPIAPVTIAATESVPKKCGSSWDFAQKGTLNGSCPTALNGMPNKYDLDKNTFRCRNSARKVFL